MAQDTQDLQMIALIDRLPAHGADAQAALRELYDLTSAKLYGVALRVVGNRSWAEDAPLRKILQIP
jgi:hypothetical protein